MGCCGSNTKLQVEIPYEKVEKYNKIKNELEQFLSSNESKEKKNRKKILDLIIKTSNEISEYEQELKKLKINKAKNADINDALLEGIDQDIKILKSHHTSLYNILKDCDYIETNEQQEIINEKYTLPNNNEILMKNQNETNLILNDNSSLIPNSERNSKKEYIYFKKYIRRNKKGILNKNKNNNAQINFMNNYINDNDKKTEQICTSENNLLDSDKERLNLIFELDNGKKVILHAAKVEKFINVIKKLGEKEDGYDNLSDLQFFDEEKDISEKIENGENVENFGLTDFHLIQVKFRNKINQL
jgi:hypothetical protein